MADKGKMPINQEGLEVLAEAILRDLENTEHGFFPNFLRRNGVIAFQNPWQVQAFMSNRAGGRIMSHRLSYLRSKKMRRMYEAMLRQKVEYLRARSAALAAELEQAQKTADALQEKREELKSRLEFLKQKAELQEALNQEISDEVQQLRFLVAQLPPSSSSSESDETDSDTNTQPPKKSD